MFSPKFAKFGLAFGAACLSIVMATTALTSSVDAQSKKSRYGLGLPKSGTASGAVRDAGAGTHSILTLLAPEDGARTLSPRPTFYWYIPPSYSEDKDTVDFFLRENPSLEAKSIFKGRATSASSGLYKLVLPASAPSLVVGKTQRWQLRWQSYVGSNPVNLNANIILENPSPEVAKELSAAKTDLAKARIYNKSGYWYDALDAYCRWIEANPKDADEARKERQAMLAEVFNEDYSPIAIARESAEKKAELAKVPAANASTLAEAESYKQKLMEVRTAISKFLIQVDAAPAILQTLKPSS